MVGAVRFELTTSWTRTKRASQPTLRPDDWVWKSCHDWAGLQCQIYLKTRGLIRKHGIQPSKIAGQPDAELIQ
jgi:hypothetical protein